jgi:hypothetical protein
MLKINTENDVLLLGEGAARQPDSATLHTWEVAGTSHVSFIGFPTRQAITRRDGLPVPDASTCNRPALSRVPTFKVLNAGWDALVRWMVEGTPPPTSPRIELASVGNPSVAQRDSFGNALGGIRLSEHEVAIAVNDGVNSGPGFCILYGSHIPFDVATLATLYSRHGDYVSEVKDVTKANVEAGFILSTDSSGTIEQADRSIIGYGYPCAAICRATQDFRVFTEGALIPDASKLVRSVDDAINALANGDSRSTAKERAKQYEKARKALVKYSSDLDKLLQKGGVQPTVHEDLQEAVQSLIAVIDQALAG